MKDLTVHKTRFAELGYWRIEPGCWSVVDITGEKPSQVGQHYPTEKSLLGNLEAYAAEYGCELANKPANRTRNQKMTPDEKLARVGQAIKSYTDALEVIEWLQQNGLLQGQDARELAISYGITYSGPIPTAGLTILL